MKLMILTSLPHHIDSLKFNANPKEYKNRTAFDSDTTNEGLYFGPYVITKIVRGSHVILGAQPNVVGQKTFFLNALRRVLSATRLPWKQTCSPAASI